MVTTLIDSTPNLPTTSVSPRIDDPVVMRLSSIAARIEGVAEATQETREQLVHHIARLERQLDDHTNRQNNALDAFERSIDHKIQARVPEVLQAVMQPELSAVRTSLDAQAVRLGSVETRLQRVETIQVESMNALDVRFNDLGFQTRLALSAGGLITIAAMLVVLLR